jgi:hypothetical protein
MKHLFLAVTALSLAGTIGTANATPDTSSSVEFWNLPTVPSGNANTGDPTQQALPSAEGAIITAGGMAFGAFTYTQPISYNENPGGDVAANIQQFFASGTGSGLLPTGCPNDATCGQRQATAPGFASVTLYEFKFTPGTTESFSVMHDDGVSLFADGTALNLLPGQSAPTTAETSQTVNLTGSTVYDLFYTSANGTPETLITNTVPVPAPLIGHGLLVLLAVGGVLFGGKFLEGLKKRHLHAA